MYAAQTKTLQRMVPESRARQSSSIVPLVDSMVKARAHVHARAHRAKHAKCMKPLSKRRLARQLHTN